MKQSWSHKKLDILITTKKIVFHSYQSYYKEWEKSYTILKEYIKYFCSLTTAILLLICTLFISKLLKNLLGPQNSTISAHRDITCLLVPQTYLVQWPNQELTSQFWFHQYDVYFIVVYKRDLCYYIIFAFFCSFLCINNT